MLWLFTQVYWFGVLSLFLGVLLRPERTSTDFNKNWSPWTIGPFITTAVLLWPLMFIIYMSHFIFRKAFPDKITLDDDDLFLQKTWTESNGKGIDASKKEVNPEKQEREKKNSEEKTD